MKGYYVCSCHGNQTDGDKCNHGAKRCRRHARVQLRIAQGETMGTRHEPGPWWDYCVGCADAIQASGMTNRLDRRPLPVSEVAA
jgi:hypothetical protein